MQQSQRRQQAGGVAGQAVREIQAVRAEGISEIDADGQRRSSTDAVRQLFLSPQPFYTLSAAAALLGWTPGEVETALRDGELEGERTCAGWNVTWEAVAGALVEQCPLREVEAALGARVGDVIPALNRLTAFHVELPRWQTLMLNALAAREHVDTGEYLARHLLDLAACEGEWLAGEIPGFAEAMRWPEK
jgi:hypothetical protein